MAALSQGLEPIRPLLFDAADGISKVIATHCEGTGPMSTFDERERAFENKFAHDEEMKFRAEARRNKLLGLWAAELMGKTGDDADAYAREVVKADFEEAGHEDVVRKVAGDLGDIADADTIRAKMDELLKIAKASSSRKSEPANARGPDATIGPRPMTNALTRLMASRDWILADGATGTNLFNMGLQSGDAPEMWNDTHPERITQLYKSAVDAGSDLFLTNSFGGNAARLKLHGAQKRARELSRIAAELGRDVADRTIARWWSPARSARRARSWRRWAR